MTEPGRTHSWWVGFLVAALVVLSGAEARTQGPAAKGKDRPAKAAKKAKATAAAPAAEARQAAEIARALRDLRQAIQAQERRRDEAGSKPALPVRPKKQFTPPTLDSVQLDALIDASLKGTKASHARLTTDEEFVRRVCLDVTGKLPTPDQVRAFCLDRARDKRARLIDYLLNTPEYARNWARYWRDVVQFHATNENPNQARYDALEGWLTDQFARNVPWDDIATALITATGPVDQNGATAFTLAQMGQPVELAGEVSRVFLGVQIQCAQCHDHPNDPWKRLQFHEFAAFFGGTRIRRIAPKEKGRPPVFEVVTRGRARYAMPDKKDPQKQIPVAPRFFLATEETPLPLDLDAADRRALVASYVTGQDNPWFARSFVNRVWYVLMGDGFYNPVDDLGPTRTPNAPEVLEALASQWQKGGYDVRWLMRTILNTRAYQREVRSTNSAAGRTPFAANCPSRLRADQIVDALAHALGIDLEANPAGRAGALAQGKGKEKGNGKGPIRQVAAPAGKRPGPANFRNQLHALFGVDPSTPNDDVMGTIPQALFLMNDPRLNRMIEARPNTVLGQMLLSTPDNLAVLNRLYLQVLARRPTPDEIETCGRYLAAVGNRKEAFEDIFWALINSTEFVSRR